MKDGKYMYVTLPKETRPLLKAIAAYQERNQITVLDRMIKKEYQRLVQEGLIVKEVPNG